MYDAASDHMPDSILKLGKTGNINEHAIKIGGKFYDKTTKKAAGP